MHDASEQLQVVRKELWRVCVPQRPDEDLVLRLGRVRAGQVPCEGHDGLERAEAKVVVALLAQLLAGE